MPTYNISGTMDVFNVDESRLDDLEFDLRQAAMIEDLDLDLTDEGGMKLRIRVLADCSSGGAHEVDRVLQEFAAQHALSNTVLTGIHDGVKAPVAIQGRIDSLLGQDGVTIEDAITELGIECSYLENDVWLVNGRQYDRNDVRGLLQRRQDEAMNVPSLT